jgi:two-component system sensor histidine kinase DegS
MTEAPAPTAPTANPTQLLRENLEIMIARAEEEVGLVDRLLRGISARIEESRERSERTRNIRTLLLRNVNQYSPEEIAAAIDDHAQATTDLALAEHQHDSLAERRSEFKDRAKGFRALLEIASEAARDARVDSAEDEAMTYRNASRQVFQIIEEERMRIARDMHDGPAQSMSNLVLQAEILERLVGRNPEQMMTELQEFKNSVRNALEETRQLIFDLRPMTLDDLGLVPTLRKYIKEYGDKFGFTTRFNVVGEERRLPGNTEGTLFRIIQEALTNVQKHGRARTAEVTLNLGKMRILATIRDDGVGFDLGAVESNLSRNRKLGLISMRERAELERGTLDIKSQPGKGTEIKVEIRLD